MARLSDVGQNTQGFSWRPVLLILILVLVVLFAMWFFSTHQKVTYVQYDLNEQAKKNDFSAATLLLQEHQKDAKWLSGTQADKQLENLFNTPIQTPKSQVLVMAVNHNFADVPALLNWVKAGGHLITYSQARLTNEDETSLADYLKKQNPLLVELGIEHHYFFSDDDSFEIDAKDEHGKQLESINRMVVPIYLPSGEIIRLSGYGYFDTKAFDDRQDVSPVADYRLVALDMPKHVQDKRLAGLTQQQKDYLLKFLEQDSNILQPKMAMIDSYLGKGRLTVLVEEDVFSNPRSDQPFVRGDEPVTENTSLNKDWLWQMLTNYPEYQKGAYLWGIVIGDNAYLLHYLTENAKQVWFIEQAKKEGLWSLLWQNVPLMMWALIIGVVAILLALPRQFGRFIQINDDSSYNFLAYFEQVGAYWWRADGLALQMQANRKQLLDKLFIRLPQLKYTNDTSKQCQIIAEIYHISPQLVYSALYADWQSERDFLQITQNFAKLSQAYDDKR